MPLYEYECSACHRLTEKIQKFSDPELTTCPYCGGPLHRTINAPAVSFKGGGWYADLYSSAKKPSASGDNKSAGAPAAKESGSGTPAASTPAASPASGSSTSSTK